MHYPFSQRFRVLLSRAPDCGSRAYFQDKANMNKSITACDLVGIRDVANQDRALLPGLSQLDRLNHGARQVFSISSFHELQVSYLSAMNQCLLRSDGVCYCQFCDTEFEDGLKEQHRAHRRRHGQLELAVLTLGYKPDGYDERERKKKRGYDLLREEGACRLVGALLVLGAWFDRSLAEAIKLGYWKQHPGFVEYVAYLTDHKGFTPDELCAALMPGSGSGNGLIREGRTYWVAVPSQ